MVKWCISRMAEEMKTLPYPYNSLSVFQITSFPYNLFKLSGTVHVSFEIQTNDGYMTHSPHPNKIT